MGRAAAGRSRSGGGEPGTRAASTVPFSGVPPTRCGAGPACEPSASLLHARRCSRAPHVGAARSCPLHLRRVPRAPNALHAAPLTDGSGGVG